MKRLACVLFMLASLASCSQPSRVEVRNAWTRDTAGRTENAAVAMTITSSTADRLVAASSPVAKRTDLMTMVIGGNAMGMEYLKGIDLPPCHRVKLIPTSLHVWLDGLKQPLKAGQEFPMVLEFQNAGRTSVLVTVIGPSAIPLDN